MSRPGAWGRVFTNLRKYLMKDWSEKVYVGEDAVGHRYYEIKNSRQNVSRGYDPPVSNPSSIPGLEWQSWLRGTRRFPPAEDEIALNQHRQQAQLAHNAQMEHRAPHVQSHGPAAGGPTDGPKSYPKYDDFEQSPGYTAPKK